MKVGTVEASVKSADCEGSKLGRPVPGMGATLAYFDSYRSARLPQNMSQAQRDAFGAHMYQRLDAPDGPFVHSNWLE